MQCQCGLELVVRQDKLLKFYHCTGCKQNLRKDKLLNSQETLDKIKLRESK